MLTALGDVLRKCYERGWITSRDGNISLRRSMDGKISQCMYITPKGVRKNKIEPEDIVKLKINDPIPEGASTEFYMHHLLLRDATSTKSVLHVHPTHVVAAMFAGWDLKELARHFPEISRYTKVGDSVEFYPAGSKELAIMTNNHLRNSDLYPNTISSSPIRFDIVGQKNHGVCAIADNPWAAFEHVERLDHICEIVLKSGVKPPKDKDK